MSIYLKTKLLYHKIDHFLLLLILAVVLASVFPCQGVYRTFFEYLTNFAVALLFFMHGAKLSRQAILNGISHWKLHLIIFCATFVLFPVLGLGLQVLVPDYLSPTLYLGFLYLCALPATVQSAIAFTSIAKGNIAAAICSAAASSVLGIFLSPILVGLLMYTQNNGGQNTLDAIIAIMYKLLLPFVLGHLCRPILLHWIEKYRKVISKTDQSSILLVVYTAFSDAVNHGIWQQIDLLGFVSIIVYSLVLLGIVLLITTYGARALGFNKEDEITIVFCGSKKSLANGIPMANVLFPAATVGIMVLPLMIFHQLQLMICAVLAARYAKRQLTHD